EGDEDEDREGTPRGGPQARRRATAPPRHGSRDQPGTIHSCLSRFDALCAHTGNIPGYPRIARRLHRTGRGGRTLQGKGATASPNETVAPGLGSWTLELPAPHLDDALRHGIIEERPHVLERN